MSKALRGAWIFQNTVILTCSLLFIAVIVTGCTNPLALQTSQASQKRGNSTLVITMKSPSSRAIVAGSGDYSTAIATIKSYKVTVTSASTNSTYTSTTVTSGTCTIAGIVAANDYSVSVYAYNDASTQNSATQIAQGGTTLAVSITAGSTTPVIVTLSFTQNAAAGAANAGGFSLNIKWPLSTGLQYIYATLDGSTAVTVSSLSTSADPYTATLSALSLKGGSHTLEIYFKTSGSATTVIGPFIESVNIWDGVTDTQWADPNGALYGSLTFAMNDFASSNANLAGLSCVNTTDSSSLTLSPAFAAGTTSYSLSSGFTGTSITFNATAVVGSQKLVCSWNGTAQSWTSVSGSTYTFTALGLALISGTNKLQITVTAPDKQTTQTYTVTVQCGAAGITISSPSPTYQGLGFPASASIVQGQSFALETSNSTLDAFGSGWTWYLDSVAQSGSSQRFVLSPATTSSYLGTYLVSASITPVAGGVTYSGRLALTVNRLALNPSGSISTLASGLNMPTAVTAANGNLYIAEFKGNLVSQVSISTGARTVIASGFNGPDGITTDGINLYVADSGTYSIKKIAIATIATGAVVTTLKTDSTNLSSIANMVTDGTNLYVTDDGGNAVRQINISTGAITTLVYFSVSGGPWGIATDGAHLFVGFPNNGSNGTIYEGPIGGGSFTPLVTGLSYWGPWGLLTDGTYLYVSDTGAETVYKIPIANPTSSYWVTLASGGSLSDPRGLATDGGSLYLVDHNSDCVFTIK
jgi:hypothetical protein